MTRLGKKLHEDREARSGEILHRSGRRLIHRTPKPEWVSASRMFPSKSATKLQKRSAVRLPFLVARGSIAPGRAFVQDRVLLMLVEIEEDAWLRLLGRQRMRGRT
jgi:hypothetical protein